MTTAIIEDGITSLCDVMLVRHSEIAQVEIPASVTRIGSQVFSGSAFFQSNVTAVTVGSSVEEIGESAFSGCADLEKVTVADTVSSIGARAFSDTP